MKHFFLFSMALTALVINCLKAQPGSLDSDFNADGIVTTNFGSNNDNIHAMVIQSDQKIIVAGCANNQFALARYNPDGSLDNTFGINGKALTVIGNDQSVIMDLVIQTDGKILAAGYTSDGNDFDFSLARYQPNGNIDSTFSYDGIVRTAIGSENDYAKSIALQTDGKIIVAGNSYNGVCYDIAIVRYNLDGTLDNNFCENGKLITNFKVLDIKYGSSASDVIIQEDGKIVIAGYKNSLFSGDDFLMVRYNTNGTMDSTFNGNGLVVTDLGSEKDLAKKIILQSDGKFIIAGNTYPDVSYSDFALVRYNSDGTLDQDFSYDGIVITEIGDSYTFLYSLAIQPDGKYVAVGQASSGSDIGTALVRYNADGTLDQSFGSNGKIITQFCGQNDGAESVALQSNGRIVVAGFSSNLSDTEFALARYMSGLVLDVTEFTTNHKMLIYPNPSDKNSTLEFTLNAPENLTFQLVDMQGRVLVTLLDNQLLEAGEYKLPIDIPDNLPYGNYLLVMSSDKGKVSIKIIR